MRLAPKIFLVSVLAILLLGAVSAWSIVAVSRLAEVNRDIATRAVPAIEIASGLPEAFRRLVRLEAKHLVLRDRAYADLWNERATRAASELDRLGTLLGTPEELKWHKSAVDAFAAYREYVGQERALMGRGEVERAQQLSERAAREAAERGGGAGGKVRAGQGRAAAPTGGAPAPRSRRAGGDERGQARGGVERRARARAGRRGRARRAPLDNGDRVLHRAAA